jgi:hypothetical protein
MNAFNTVNMAAGCIITSSQFAKELGIPEDRWIYPLGGAGMSEKSNCTSWSKHLGVVSLMVRCSLGKAQLLFQYSIGEVFGCGVRSFWLEDGECGSVRFLFVSLLVLIS